MFSLGFLPPRFFVVFLLSVVSYTPTGEVPPGAFLVEDAQLGTQMTIPAGSKLVSVDDTITGNMEFARARAVALEAGKDSVLVFE